MRYQLFTNIALNRDIPKHGIKKGDIATIVEHHPAVNGNQDGYSLEIFNAPGQTIAIVVVNESAIKALEPDEILHVRQRETITP